MLYQDLYQQSCEVRGEKREQRSPIPALGWVVGLGRSVGGCGGREGGQQDASLSKAEKAYVRNALARGETTQHPGI